MFHDESGVEPLKETMPDVSSVLRLPKGSIVVPF